MSRKAPWIYAPSPEEIAEKKAAAKAEKAAERWGVFQWEAANQYRNESAIKVYKLHSAAEKYADAHNSADHNRNLVVRQMRS